MRIVNQVIFPLRITYDIMDTSSHTVRQQNDNKMIKTSTFYIKCKNLSKNSTDTTTDTDTVYYDLQQYSNAV